MGPHVRIPFIDFMSNGGERSETFNLNVMRSGESSGSVFLPSLCISSRQTYFSSFGIHQIHPKLLSEYNFLQYDQPDLYDSRSETLRRLSWKSEWNNISAGELPGPSYSDCSDGGQHPHCQGSIWREIANILGDIWPPLHFFGGWGGRFFCFKENVYDKISSPGQQRHLGSSGGAPTASGGPSNHQAHT